MKYTPTIIAIAVFLLSGYSNAFKIQSRTIVVSHFARKLNGIGLNQIKMSENENNNIITETTNIEGYLNSDLNKIDDSKQTRVFLYIILALAPCLLLVPFLMTRDFVPPTDPEAYRF